MKPLALVSFSLAAFLAVAAGCGRGPSSQEGESGSDASVTIFAAASTTNALEEIKQQFADRTGVTVRTSFASSGTLARQIESGADADVFLSADVKWVEELAGHELVVEQRNLLGNQLVVIVPADSKVEVKTLEDLAAASIGRLALGDTKGVPAGMYARQALTKANVWDKVKNKVVSSEDVRHALAFVETGAAEAGIVYATDAAISKKVRVALQVPAGLTEPILYPAVLLKPAAGKAAAREFYDYLATPPAAKIFEKYGFVVVAERNGGKK